MLGTEREKKFKVELKTVEEEFNYKLEIETKKSQALTDELDEVRLQKQAIYAEKDQIEQSKIQMENQIVAGKQQMLMKHQEIANFEKVLGSLQVTLMERDKECQQLVNKLTQMKQQIIDNEHQHSVLKKFGAVKIGAFSKTACTMGYLTIADQTPHQYFLLIDSKSSEISINCENIESFVMKDDFVGLQIIYFLPQKDWLGNQKAMERRVDEYECAEAEFLVKTFQNIRRKIMQRALQEEMGPASTVQRSQTMKLPAKAPAQTPK